MKVTGPTLRVVSIVGAAVDTARGDVCVCVCVNRGDSESRRRRRRRLEEEDM